MAVYIINKMVVVDANCRRTALYRERTIAATGITCLLNYCDARYPEALVGRCGNYKPRVHIRVDDGLVGAHDRRSALCGRYSSGSLESNGIGRGDRQGCRPRASTSRNRNDIAIRGSALL